MASFSWIDLSPENLQLWIPFGSVKLVHSYDGKPWKCLRSQLKSTGEYDEMDLKWYTKRNVCLWSNRYVVGCCSLHGANQFNSGDLYVCLCWDTTYCNTTAVRYLQLHLIWTKPSWNSFSNLYHVYGVQVVVSILVTLTKGSWVK